MQRATPHFCAERAGVRLFSDLEYDFGDVGRDNAVFHADRIAEFSDGGEVLPLEAHVHRNGNDFVLFRVEAAHFGKGREQGERVFSARDTDGDPISLVDHAVIVYGTAGKT